MNRSLISLTFLLAACSTTISNFDKYKKAPFLETQFMPTKQEMTISIPNIVIFDFKNESENAQKVGSAQIVQNTMSNALVTSKLATIFSRNKSDDVKNELAIAEGSRKKLKLPEAVRYVISGSISSATFSGGKNSTGGFGDNAAGTEVSYVSEVQGVIKIDELPSLQNALTLDISGKYKQVENRKTGLAALAGDILGDEKNIKTFDGTVVKRATEDAITKALPDVKNFFARSGYVLEKRTYEDKMPIFKINIGLKDGIVQNDKIKIIQVRTEENSITGETSRNNVILCTASVADQNTDLTAWIVIKDKTCAEQIRLGDLVKVVYAKSSRF